MTAQVDDPAPGAGGRTAELTTNLARVRARIAAGCAAVGRDPAGVTLVAVTKTFPATDVIRLAGLGLSEFGEARDQEAAPKAVEVGRAGVEVRWHFVGRLQRNKCASVVRYADLAHTVDSVRLATALGAAAATGRARPLEVLVQVSVDGDPGRGGAPAEELARVTEAVAGQGSLRLRGVMAVAPRSWEPRAAFARLAELAATVREAYPDATVISAGMSADLDAALAEGATHLRIGGALLGNRAPLR